VQFAKVDRFKRQVDFKLAEPSKPAARQPPARNRGRGGERR
jgi:hypothetical protein